MESLLSSSWYQLTDPQSTPDVMVQVFATLNIALDGVSPEVRGALREKQIERDSIRVLIRTQQDFHSIL
jgi:hypothetical protein